MFELLLACPLLLAPHGGQYIPPAPDPGTPPPIAGIVAQPGLGPQLTFDASRWEWWFDFNQEPLLDLRNRMPARARTAGATFDALTADDRRALVALFVDALQDKSAVTTAQPVAARVNPRDVRAAAVLSLGRLQLPDAVPYIELALERDVDIFVRTQAVLALGFSGSPQAVETLVRLFHDEGQSAEIRTYAVVGLGLVGNGQAVDVLRAALGEKALAGVNNQLRDAVVYAAGVCGDPGLGDSLRAVAASYSSGHEPDVRALVAFAFGRLGDAASIPPLFELLKDSDNQVRRSAATAFESLQAPLTSTQVELLAARLHDESDAPVRRTLLHVLGLARTEASRTLLAASLMGTRTDERPHAALGLALDGNFNGAAPLLAALKDEHEASAEGALALALGLLGAPDAKAPLTERFLAAKDPLLQPNLLLAVGLLDPDSPDVATRCDELARTSVDVEVVRCAIIALGLLGDRPHLAKLAADAGKIPGSVHRAAVVFGLGLVGDRHLLDPLRALATDLAEPAYVRAYALQALGELGDPRPISPCSRLSRHADLDLDVGFLFELYHAF